MEINDLSIKNNFKKIIDDINQYFKSTAYENSIIDFLVDEAQRLNLSVKRDPDYIYIQKGDKPGAVLHFNLLEKNIPSKEISLKDMGETVNLESSFDINLTMAILAFAYLMRYSSCQFDILFTRINVYLKDNNYENLKYFIRSENIINLNLNNNSTIADKFAGLRLASVSIPIERVDLEDKNSEKLKISIENLTGGHSAYDIDKTPNNAIKLLNSFLRSLRSRVDFDLVSISGGSNLNNIPSDSYAVISILENYLPELKNTYDLVKKEFIAKNLRLEPNLKISLENFEDDNSPSIDGDCFRRISSFIELAPTGVYSVNSQDGQIISSSNLSTIRTGKGLVKIALLFRSLTEENFSEMINKTNLAARLAGGELSVNLISPVFYNKSDCLTQVFKNTYKDLFNKELLNITTQYSLDSSIIFNNYHVRMVSLGVKYKQDKCLFKADLNDILSIVLTLDGVLKKLS